MFVVASTAFAQAPIVQDSFAGPTGTSLQGRAPDIGPTGATWSGWAPVSAASLQNGVVGVTQPGSPLAQPWSVPTALSDVSVAVDYLSPTSPAYGGLIARLVDYNNYIALITDGSTSSIALYRRQGGTSFLIGSASQTFVNGQTYRLELRAVGSQLAVYVNGVLRLAATESFQQTATAHGIFWHQGNPGVTFDNFLVTAASTVTQPGTVAWDTFTGATGTSLQGRAPDIGPTGATWSRWAPVSAASLQSGVAGITEPGSPLAQPWTVPTGLSDVSVAVDYRSPTSPAYGGLVARLVDYNNYIALITDGSTSSMALYRRQGGTSTLIGSTSQTFVNGQTYRLELRTVGATLTAYVNGVLRLTATESFQQTATAHGIFWHQANPGVTFDHFLVTSSLVPTITALSPAAGPVASSVTITGSNFGATQGTSAVKFNGTTATPTAWSATSITVPVPAGATTGPVTVTVGGIGSNGVMFTVTTGPVLVLDTFTGANNTTLASHPPDIAPGGATWVSHFAAMPYLTNGALTSGATGTIGGSGLGLAAITSGVADGTVSVKFKSTVSFKTVGVAVRVTDANNLLVVRYSVNDGVPLLRLYLRSGGGWSVLAEASVPVVDGNWHQLGAILNGTSVTGVLDGVNRFTVNVATHQTVARHGVFWDLQYDPLALFDDFEVRPLATAPTISSLSPSSGAVGTSVSITGTNFGATQGTSTVKFNGTTATPTAWSATSITAPVPSGATTGPVTVTVGGTASNGVTFTVVSGGTGVRVSDTFTGANGTTLPSHPPDLAPSGSSWTVHVGPSQVLSNGTLALSGGGSNNAISAIPSGTADGTVAVDFRSTATLPLAGLALRVTDQNNLFVLRYYQGAEGGPTVHLWQRVGGNWSILASAPAPAAGSTWHRLEARLSGSGITAVLDGVVLFTQMATAHQTVASHGLFWDLDRDTSTVYDNFAVILGTAPTISSLSPSAGPVGTIVTITGTSFGATQGTSTVTFNGTTATPTAWSATSITAPVPSGAATGNVIVTVGGVASSGVAFTVIPPPNITSLSPTSGDVGTVVTVTGTNFGATQGTSTVKFNGTTATPTAWSATSITVPVPSGATTGNVVVTVGGVASNGVAFTVIPPPNITSLSPTSGGVGTVVTVTGTNFGATQGTSTVKFNGTTATPTAWSATSITAPVPSGATTGPVTVTVNGTASNGVTFTVTSAGPVVWDTFTGANNTTLAAHPPDIAPGGAAWVSHFAAMPYLTSGALTSGATGTIGGSGLGLAGITSGLADGTVSVKFKSTVSTKVVGVAVRVTDANNLLVVRYSVLAGQPKLVLFRREGGGGWNVLAEASVPSVDSNWHQLGAILSGTSVTGVLDGVNYFTVNVSNFQTVVRHGLFWDLQQDPFALFDDFEVRPLGSTPTITSLSPTSGPVGTSVTVTGANFGATQAASTLKFNGTTAAPTAWSATSITAPVPSGATTGPLTVTVGGVASNGVTFTVTSAGPMVWDTFTGANNTTLASHPPDIAPGGATWVSHFAAMPYLTSGALTSGATGTIGGSGLGLAAITSGLADGTVSVKFKSTVSFKTVGVAVRVTDANNLLVVRYSVNDGVPLLRLYQRAGGGWSVLAEASVPVVDGNWHQLGAILNGASVTGVLDGVNRFTVNVATHQTVARHGVFWDLQYDPLALFDDFEVRPLGSTPTITSLSPTSGPVGTSVTVAGANFGGTQGSSVVRFNGTLAAATSWTAGSITVVVPSGATTGPVVVTVGGVPSNGATFTVTGAGGGCTFAVAPSAVNVVAAGGSGSVSLTASAPSCAWDVSTPESWLTFSPVAGTGGATITFVAQANGAATARTATVSIGTASFTVIQAGSYTPTEPPDDGGDGGDPEDVPPAPTSSTTIYYHTDALGSVRMITSQSGTVLSTHDYFPFGQVFGSSTTAAGNKLFFTGKERDTETAVTAQGLQALDYFGARSYQSQIGRFTSPDSVNSESALSNPQLWNRYAYAMNAPLNYVDPDGHWPFWIHNMVYEAVLGGILTKSQMMLLEGVSYGMDFGRGGTDASNSYQHSMCAGGVDAHSCSSQIMGFIDSSLSAARRLSSGNRLTDLSIFYLGRALHSLSDMGSPMHTSADLSPFSYSGGVIDLVRHINGESWTAEHWQRIRLTARIVAAAFEPFDFTGKIRKAGGASAYADRAFADLVNQRYLTFDPFGDPAERARSRACALGNPAACQ